MVMIAHQAVCLAESVVPIIDLPEKFKKQAPVIVILEDGLPCIAPDGDMIHGTVIFYAEWACHECTLA